MRSNGLYPSLYISSPVGAIGTVTVPGLGITNTFSVAAGGGTNIDIDPSIMMDGYDMVETNGIHITASQPVSVYAVAYAEWTSSSFTGYPTTLLGTNYCVMARAPMDGAPGDVSPYSQFAIVATADNTTVKITPSPAANLWNHSETNYYMTINEGQIVAQLTITNTLVDGSPVAATNFVAIGSSGYSGGQIPVETGWHTVTSAQPVGVQVYGFGETDAYGYFGGIVKWGVRQNSSFRLPAAEHRCVRHAH